MCRRPALPADNRTDRGRIAAICTHRFISKKVVFTRNNLLPETERIAAHHSVSCFVADLCSHSPNDQARTMPLKASRYRQTRNNSRIVKTIAVGSPSGAIKM